METEDTQTAAGRGSVIARLAAMTLGAIVVLVTACSFVAQDNERVIVLRFGKPVRVPEEAGWYARWPWPIEQTRKIDARLRYDEIRLSETLTRDKRNIIVPMYFAWRVSDPLQYLKAIGMKGSGSEKLDAVITSARNSALGQIAYPELFDEREGQSGIERLETSVLERVREVAQEQFGIEIAGVGAVQLNLPEANTESVFRRMRAERKREASRYRAEGKSKSEQIRADTDKDVAVLLAEAKRYAEETRGMAEAEAARIYASAHEKDPEFYLFLRQLQSLRTVVDKNTTLVLDTNAPPFSLLRPDRSEESTLIDAVTLTRPSIATPLRTNALGAIEHSEDGHGR